MRPVATLVGVLLLSAAPHVQTPAPTAAPPTFHLLFIGHDIGGETDTVRRDARGTTFDCAFHLVDRATTLDLAGSVSRLASGEPAHFQVEGHSYRLFRSDSEVTLAGRRAHVRDLGAERDVDTGGRPFFPIDSFAPVGVQEALIQYWLARGRPAGKAAAPSGPVVRIAARGETTIAGDGGAPAMRRACPSPAPELSPQRRPSAFADATANSPKLEERRRSGLHASRSAGLQTCATDAGDERP